MATLAYWVWLSSRAGLSARKAARLLEEFGTAGDVFRADETALSAVGELSSEDLAVLADKNLAKPAAILEDCAALHIQVITLQDAAYPERLRQIDDPPPVLYVLGHLPPLDLAPAIAVVGTRRPSAYGYFSARKAGFQLASGGAVVVSGLAAGCDGAAAKGALLAGQPTVAVVAGGPDVCYPEENRPLYEEIVKNGAVVSEYPPKTAITRLAFPRRNRLISGLCHGVVVAEAPLKSGALITAEHALAQGRDVFAIPSNLDSPTGQGSNRLIQQGAQLFISGSDVLASLAPQFGGRLDLAAAEMDLPRPDFSNRPAETQSVSLQKDPMQAEIVGLLQEHGALSADEIAEGIAALRKEAVETIFAAAASALTMLELQGRVEQKPGGLFGLQ